ncbi:hypothetical protein GCM10010145_35350 [Streptomyces ruber]|uniref:Uncharacterized protein n=2 Tax=Streptomyces TaxID=1883 RepID=A0A918BE85_9ACTN|nr:hypothetical protein [Streptomyces ruber]GGQ62380.1 hypothetical protein GCM10010145_35350 [Streptomyces ruber]
MDASLRLLPWTSPEGNPCYLSTDRDGGYLPRFADAAEARQLAAGADVLGRALPVLADPMSPYAEVQYTAIRLGECLADALRVAESRGLRLPVRTTWTADQGRSAPRVNPVRH